MMKNKTPIRADKRSQYNHNESTCYTSKKNYKGQGDNWALLSDTLTTVMHNIANQVGKKTLPSNGAVWELSPNRYDTKKRLNTNHLATERPTIMLKSPTLKGGF